MAGTGRRYLLYLYVVLLLLTLSSGSLAHAAEISIAETAATEPSITEPFFGPVDNEPSASYDIDILSEEELEIGDKEIEALTGELMEELQNAKTIKNPPLKRTYLEETGIFTYVLPNKDTFSANVPDGMITNGPVTFSPMENAYIVATKNGMMGEVTKDGSYTEPGTYVFKMAVFPGKQLSGDKNYYQVQFGFQILPAVVSDISLYSAPEGFCIKTVTYNGTEREPENPEWEFLYEDGDYTVEMVDRETGAISYRASFSRDSEAPFLFFTPGAEHGKWKQPVMITMSEPHAMLRAFHNGAEGVLISNVISEEGLYEFYVSDPAGNSRYYKLKMEGKPRWRPGRSTVILTIIGAAGLMIFLIYQRRHMRFL